MVLPSYLVPKTRESQRMHSRELFMLPSGVREQSSLVDLAWVSRYSPFMLPAHCAVGSNHKLVVVLLVFAWLLRLQVGPMVLSHKGVHETSGQWSDFN